MEEPAQDPLDLVKQLVLLIVEARTPDISVKGRVEGPHCPVIRGGLPHHCARDKKECLRAREFCGSATQLWTNKIPICIDILLFPDCCHGGEEVMVTEGAVTSMVEENALLVERWMVVSEKRRHDSGLGSNLLLQAVRSYLHFSQISSWLYSEKGKLPNLLVYRIYAPGEEASLDFLKTPDSHAFPFCILRCDSIKVSVSAMQRVSQVPVLVCASESHEQHKLCESESDSEGGLLRGKQSRLKHMDETEGQASYSAQKSHYKKEEIKAMNNFEKPKPRSRKISNQDYLSGKTNYDVKETVLRWTENWSAISKSKVTDLSEGKYPRKKNGTGMGKKNHKDILKEPKNGTKEKKTFYLEKSNDWKEEILKPKAHPRKKDGGKDQRIEQMKCAAVLEKGVETQKLMNSMNKIKPQQTKNKMFLTKQDEDLSFLLMNNAVPQKEQFWTNFSKNFGSNFEKGETVGAAYLSHQGKEKSRLDKRSERLTETLCNKGSFKKSAEWDMQMPPSSENPSSQLYSADEFERKSYLAASEAYEEEFIRRLSERMTLVQTKPSVKSQSPEVKALLFTSEQKNQDIKTKADLVFKNASSPKRKDKFSTCPSQQDTLRPSQKHTSKSPSITEVTTKTIPGQSFQDLLNIGENEMTVVYKESNVCDVAKSAPPLSQLSVDISWSDFEMEWDSDDTPTASPDHLNSSRCSGSSLLKAVTARQMMGAMSNATNDLDKEDIAEPHHCTSPVIGQGFESVIFENSSPSKSRENEYYDSTVSKSSFPNFHKKGDILKDAFFDPSKEISLDEAESLPNKKSISDNLSIGNDAMVTNGVVRPQGAIRKTFEENLLPLASYDAHTDSFMIVDPNNQVKVLHSPKVLLSCNVPTEEAISPEKGRCINFEEDVISEIFISRLQEITPSHGLPHGIESYMSHLAAISLEKEHKREPMVNGESNVLQDENVANELKNTENKLGFLKNGAVCKLNKTKDQGAKVLQDVVVRVHAAANEGNREREGKIDLEKEKIYDQMEGFHYFENVVERTVEGDKSLKDAFKRQSELCNTRQSDLDHSKLNSDTKDYCPSASPAMQASLSPSLSSSTSFSLTKYTLQSSSHLLRSSSPGSSIHSTPSAHSFPISLALDKSQDYSDIEAKEWTDFKSLTDQGSNMLLKNPTDDTLQKVFDFSTLDKEKLCSLSCDRDKHPSNTLSTNGKSHWDNLTLFHNTYQQPYKCSDNLAADISALASLSMVDAENQPHSQELAWPRSPAQICDKGTKSSDHALTNTFVQKDCAVSEYRNNEQKTRIPSTSDKVANSYSNLLLESFPEVDNHITFNDCSSELTTNEPESALKDFSYESALDSESRSTDSTVVISNDFCQSTNGVLKLSSLSSLSNSKNPTSCSRMSKSQNLSDISDDIKGSSFQNLNAIGMCLQASQSLSFQTTCDNEEGKSLTFQATNIDNDIRMNFSSSTGIELSKAAGSQFADINTQQIIAKSDLDVSASQIGISEEAVYKNKNKDNTHIASLSSERVLINHSEHNQISSNPDTHEDISQSEMIGQFLNKSKLQSIEAKAENGFPMNSLLHKDANSSSQTYGSDPDVCYVSRKEQCHVCHSFIADQLKTKAISHKKVALSSASKCAHSGGTTCEDSDDNEVFFYLDENAAPNVPNTCSTPHPSSLASSLMLSSSSSPLLSTPFSSVSNVHIGKPSSLSTEAGMDLECSANHDLDQGPFRRSRMASYGDNLPGWTINPPHRSVSTPDCAEGEVRGRGYQRSTCSRSTSVLQQNDKDGVIARKAALMSSSMIFNSRTALPTQSSPAPLKRKPGARFDYDASLLNVRALKNACSCSKLTLGKNEKDDDNEDNTRLLSTSAPASTNCLLGNFEESILNGRIDPVGTVDGFSAEIGASGSFCPKHLHLPVSAFFFALSDDNAPSPYLGHINLNAVNKKGYHIPKKGTVQVTLFNPNKTVVKMFVVMYDLSDMPPSSQTFIRQRTMYIPTDKNSTSPSYLRYLIHLRCSSSRSGKIYLHTDIRLIFARHKLDIDAKTVPYELKSYTDVPRNPKYSPKK